MRLPGTITVETSGHYDVATRSVSIGIYLQASRPKPLRPGVTLGPLRLARGQASVGDARIAVSRRELGLRPCSIALKGTLR